MRDVKLIAVRTPSGIRLGYERYVGKVFKYTGNNYDGFQVILQDGSKIPMLHFNIEYVEQEK